MKFRCIEQNKKAFPITVLCKVFKVSVSGYHRWQTSPESKREQEESMLVRTIEAIHRSSRQTYGSPRVHAQLKGLGHEVNKKRVERLMKKHGIRSKLKRKFRQTTDSNHRLPVSENILNRDFSPKQMNQSWCGDITYVWTQEGWLFLAVILDLFSRQVVGWSMDKTMTKKLTMDALEMAFNRRQIGPGLIFHSDRGSQYASRDYRAALRDKQAHSSMSRRGNCWDNSVAESFFHSLKTEMTFFEEFETREEARRKIFEWIEVFYNRERLHSTLGYLSPEKFEMENIKQCA